MGKFCSVPKRSRKTASRVFKGGAWDLRKTGERRKRKPDSRRKLGILERRKKDRRKGFEDSP